MFFLLFSLISFQSIFKVKPNLNVFDTHFSFGFEKGGNYSVKIENCKFDELLFVIATGEEMNKCDKTKMINDSCYLQFKYSQHLKLSMKVPNCLESLTKKVFIRPELYIPILHKMYMILI